MAKVYKTAMGKQIDVDSILLRNEHVIAVGNYKVNARGDELGPGGSVARTRDQVMKEYYTLNTPMAADPTEPTTQPAIPQQQQNMVLTSPPPLPPMFPPGPENSSGIAPLVFAPTVINPDSGLDEVEPEIVVVTPALAPQLKLQADKINHQPIPIPVVVEEYKVPDPVPAADQTLMIPVMPGPGTPAEIVPVIHHEHKSDPGMPMAPATVIRGKMANALAAKPATVTQKEKLLPKKANGIQRF